MRLSYAANAYAEEGSTSIAHALADVSADRHAAALQQGQLTIACPTMILLTLAQAWLAVSYGSVQ